MVIQSHRHNVDQMGVEELTNTLKDVLNEKRYALFYRQEAFLLNLKFPSGRYKQTREEEMGNYTSLSMIMEKCLKGKWSNLHYAPCHHVQ